MPEANPRILVMDPADSVAVALVALAPGEAIAGLGVRPLEPIPAGHKIALAPVAAGAPVIKYGQIIGFASRDIAPGQHVHVHNVALHQFDRDYAIGSQLRPTDFLPEESRATFQGFARPDGQAGTRNYLGVIATVNCSATVARLIAQAVGPGELAKYPHVDGIVPLTHGTGCAMDPQGEGYQLLQRTLAGAARNPNFAGVLLVGLGCETNLVETLLQKHRPRRKPPPGHPGHPGRGRHQKDRGPGSRPAAPDARRRRPTPAQPPAGQPAGAGHGVRRLRRLLRHHRQPLHGPGGRPPHPPRRHRHPERDPRDLRGRAPPDPPHRGPSGGPEAHRAHPLVGEVHRPPRAQIKTTPARATRPAASPPSWRSPWARWPRPGAPT